MHRVSCSIPSVAAVILLALVTPGTGGRAFPGDEESAEALKERFEGSS